MPSDGIKHQSGPVAAVRTVAIVGATLDESMPTFTIMQSLLNEVVRDSALLLSFILMCVSYGAPNQIYRCIDQIMIQTKR